MYIHINYLAQHENSSKPYSWLCFRLLVSALTEFIQLVQEAKEKRYPDTGLVKSLQKCVQEAEKCAALATQLVTRNLRQALKPSHTNGDKRSKLSISELQQFLTQMKSLSCVVKESALIEVCILNKFDIILIDENPASGSMLMKHHIYFFHNIFKSTYG